MPYNQNVINMKYMRLNVFFSTCNSIVNWASNSCSIFCNHYKQILDNNFVSH